MICGICGAEMVDDGSTIFAEQRWFICPNDGRMRMNVEIDPRLRYIYDGTIASIHGRVVNIREVGNDTVYVEVDNGIMFAVERCYLKEANRTPIEKVCPICDRQMFNEGEICEGYIVNQCPEHGGFVWVI